MMDLCFIIKSLDFIEKAMIIVIKKDIITFLFYKL